jgi:hypothetical protein
VDADGSFALLRMTIFPRALGLRTLAEDKLKLFLREQPAWNATLGFGNQFIPIGVVRRTIGLPRRIVSVFLGPRDRLAEHINTNLVFFPFLVFLPPAEFHGRNMGRSAFSASRLSGVREKVARCTSASANTMHPAK